MVACSSRIWFATLPPLCSLLPRRPHLELLRRLGHRRCCLPQVSHPWGLYSFQTLKHFLSSLLYFLSCAGTWAAASVQQDLSEALQDCHPHCRLDGPHLHHDHRQLLSAVLQLNKVAAILLSMTIAQSSVQILAPKNSVPESPSFVCLCSKLVNTYINQFVKKNIDFVTIPSQIQRIRFLQ